MFTIEEARNSRPLATRRIPHGATLEYSQKDVQRALEAQDRAEAQERTRFLHRYVEWLRGIVGKTAAQFGPAMQPGTRWNDSD